MSTLPNEQKRQGEVELHFDPSTIATDASLVFIGRVHSPWHSRENCPKNMGAAREAGMAATVEIDEVWREGLTGLEAASHVILLTWLDRAPRNLIVQKPRHASRPTGTFSLRSPARPNPIGLHVARLIGLDNATGILHIEGIDVLDETPVIDIKPYYASADAILDATVAKA